MGAAADDLKDDLAENEGPRKREERKEPGVSLSGRRLVYQIDRSSSISARANLGIEDGKLKAKAFGVEYRKEF